jgi:serine O-acetyltransferase
MTWQKLKRIVGSDLYRHSGAISGRAFWEHFVWTPGFRYSTLLRVYGFLRETAWGRYGFRQTISLLLRRYSIRYGISISPDTKIGPGFYIGHFGGIVVNEAAVIGNNCNLSHGVTIGQLNRGPAAGCPTIGDNVYIGPGAKIVGRIHIGDGAAVGANAVVVNDVPPRTSVGGVPARVISDKGSEGYVNRTNYPEIPAN